MVSDPSPTASELHIKRICKFDLACSQVCSGVVNSTYSNWSSKDATRSTLVASLLLVAMHLVTSSFFAPSSDALCS